MAKFKVGDKVRVRKFETRPDHWNSDGGMDHWMGEIVTLETINQTRKNPDSSRYVTSSVDFSLREDKKEFRGVKWVWKESDFELIEPRREFIVIRRDGAKTIAELRHDREVIKSGTATCAPSDTFDFNTGAKLAFDRLMGREEPKPAPQPAHRFKVGDRVLHEEYGLGTIIGYLDLVPSVPYLVEPDNGNCFMNHWAEAAVSPAPAPEPPKFYTGKVFAEKIIECDAREGMHNRIGRVFEIKNGIIQGDVKQYDLDDYDPIVSFSDFCLKAGSTKWHEVKSDV